MLNLNYATLATAYRHYDGMTPAALRETLGCSESAMVRAGNGAVLTSLALISAGVQLSGPLKIENGPLTGRKLENAPNRLAEWLATRHREPENLALTKGLADVAYQLFGRRGIVAFIQGTGPAGGSIALLDGKNATPHCVAAEALHPQAVYFWEIA